MKKVYKVLDSICVPVASTLLLVIVVLTFVNVILRFFFSAPIAWAEEISGLLYTFMIYIGLSETHKQDTAVSVDVLTSILPEKIRRVLNVGRTLFCMVTWSVLIVLGVQLVLATTTSDTAYLHIPYRYVYMIIPISGFFCMVQLIHRLILQITGKTQTVEEQ